MRHHLVGQKDGKVTMKRGESGSPIKRVAVLLLVLAVMLNLLPASLNAAAGTADGTYHFGDSLGANDSGGPGFKKQGDKFVVTNGFAQDGTSLWSEHLQSPNTSGELVIKAEGQNVLDNFTFQNLGISAYSDLVNPRLDQLTVTLKDAGGAVIATHSSAGSVNLYENGVNQKFQISTLLGNGTSYNYSNVVSVTLQWRFSNSLAPSNLNIDDITLTNMISPIPQDTPTFNPAAGAVAFGTELEIISAGAEHIYYTTDGSTPATAVGGSTLEYNASAKPAISGAMTVKAIATKTGKLVSTVGIASYTQAATANLTGLALSGSPSGFVFAGGTYAYNGVTVANGVASVTVTPSGAGTLTVDGTTVASGAASAGITLTPGVERTITVVATETGKSAKTYVIKVTREQATQVTPTFNPAAGAVAFGTELEIISAGADHIYYTTDGSTPATVIGGSTLEYNAMAKPVINAAMTVKAIATKTNNLDSAVASASYTQAATADLTDVELSGAPSGFVFAGGTYAYNGVTVANGVASVTVTPSGAGTLTVDGTTVASGAASAGITLTPGVERTITVVATETGKSAKMYVIKVTREQVAQETPTFNPAAGAVAFGTELEMVSAGADHIYYTTDGSTPATAVGGSTLEYNAAAKPVINAAMTVKAIATKSNNLNSAVASASYTQATTADLTDVELSGTPSGFAFAGGTYAYNGVTVANSVASVTVTPSGAGTLTVDGTTVASGAASAGITLTPGVERTITVIATETGKSAKTYVIKVTREQVAQETPTFNPAAGAVAFGTELEIVSAGADHIYYTTDGSTPATAVGGSTLEYNAAAKPVISAAMTVKAIATKTNNLDSAVASASYTQAATADLTDVELSGTPSGFAFAGGTYAYNGVTVDNSVASVTVTPSGAGTLTVDGTTVASGAASAGITLTPGVERTITVVATETGKSAKTYVIKVTREQVAQETPTFNPAAGEVAFGTELEIVSAGADHIYYTTDGSTPATAVGGSTLEYNAAAKPVINAAMTVNAIATKTDNLDSAVASASYTQAATADLTDVELSGAPSGFAFAGGTYAYNGVTVDNSVASVTVTPSGAGTLTVDGATVASGAASAGILLTPGVERTITVVATETGKSAKTYVIKVTREQVAQETPTFNPAAGAVAFGTELEIVSAGADHIYYTTDGSMPATAVGGSTLEYNAAAKPVINAAMTVKAIATKADNLDSAIASASYTQAEVSDLTSLVLSGSPSGFVFASGTYDYSGLTVPYSVSTITVTPSGAGTIKVDGATIASGMDSSPISLNADIEQTITIVVEEAGKLSKTYTVKVTRLNIQVPGTSTAITAAPGNAQAVVSFTAPVDNGGSPVKGYEVTAMPGNITVSGVSSPITVTGLTNGTTYTFTVKALNIAGSSASSAESNAVTPTAPSSGGSSGGSGGGSTSNPSTPTTTGVNVLINGTIYNIGSTTTTMVNNQSVTTLTVNQAALKSRLADEASGVVVTFPVDIKSGSLIVKLNGDNVRALEQKQAVVKIQTGSATYTLSVEQIAGSSVIRELLQQTGLDQLEFQIELAALTPSRLQEVKTAAAKGGFELIGEPFEFTVKVVNGTTRQEIAKFNTYVEREIAIPSTVDPQRITTAIVIEADGSIRHVPTKIVQANGSYWAKIYSLTNSTYALVWNPVEFQDAAGHWAQQAINDMGSRMVISGVGGDRFNPNASITRAEFAAIMVRGLGLKLETGASGFSDVQASAWYNQAIQTAVAYKLINGFEDGTFRPNEPITREQATIIIAKAMAITGLKAGLPEGNADDILRPYADANEAAAWARSSLADSLQGGILSGRSGMQLAPKAVITRAEIAVMVQRLLVNSKLI
ncbi:cadherin-like beta sandwich domain-containing protein [Paenibacillus algorifonticola]|uniref:cadherin-like beta sandwich domain-containing protein n=1 Tax=Paenibacillus algorifonticola TaxID=684063 RepID=UPI003D29765E